MDDKGILHDMTANGANDANGTNDANCVGGAMDANGASGAMGANGANGANDASGANGANGLAPIAASGAGAIIAAMHGGGGAGLEVPKPFSQPICLVPETRVAGTMHVTGISEIAGRLSEGDRLNLERDPANARDRWAIRVFDGSGNRLGFVPADVNEIPARLMDGGKRLYAEVTDVDRRGSWWRIGMGVWLDD